MNDSYLKSFILYCQAVEVAYNEWKNYWIKVLTEDKETMFPIPHNNTDILERLRKIYNLD